MSLFGLDPALWRLLALKRRGRLRLAWRRLKTPRGLVFGLVGALLFVLWIASLVLRLREGAVAPRGGDPHASAALAIGVYALFAVTANLSWRGLYLPRPELERLLSAPLARGALVRYRLLGMALPTAFVALFVGLVTASRVPTPTAGFLAGVLVVCATTSLGQGAALLAARPDGRIARALGRLPGGAPRVVGALGLAGVLLALLFADELAPSRDFTTIVRDGEVLVVTQDQALDDPREDVAGMAGRLAAIASHPVTRALTAPTYPFAAAAAAEDLRAAWPWLAASLALVLALFELVARLPIDYREASLATSQDVERRLARLRRGQFGAAAADAGALRGWRVPFWLGAGPFGAVVWLKTAALLRQGRSALAIATVATSVGVVFGVTVLPEGLPGTAALVMLGVAYLASGLRFDFRAELDRMQVLRAWPLGSWQVFVAGVLPVTAFVALFLTVMLAVRGAVVGADGLETLAAVCATPIAAFLWIALDNAVFLLFPVRFVPGTGGALQHSGRALLMVLLRVLVLGGVGLVATLTGVAASIVAEWLGLGLAVVHGAMVSAAALTLLGVAAGLAALGGYALSRFDPAEAARAAG